MREGEWERGERPEDVMKVRGCLVLVGGRDDQPRGDVMRPGGCLGAATGRG